MSESRRTYVTISSPNYVGGVELLASSLGKFDHDSDLYYLCVGGEGRTDGLEKSGVKTVNLEEIGINDWKRMAFKYDLVEFNTAVKPFLIKYLFKKMGASEVIYIDPDVYFYADIKPVWKMFEKYSVLLTPHLLYPDSRGILKKGYAANFLRAGVFNLGFLGVKNNRVGNRMLDWWGEKLRDFCTVDVANGLYTDQKWADFFPIFFKEVGVVRDDGCNVAYWNLDERHVMREVGGRYLVRGKPLRFFHFSAFGPDVWPSVSSYLGYGRVDSWGKAVERLYRDYLERLNSVGWRDKSRLSYKYDYYDNGKKITREERKIYKKLFLDRGEDRANPFDGDGYRKIRFSAKAAGGRVFLGVERVFEGFRWQIRNLFIGIKDSP